MRKIACFSFLLIVSILLFPNSGFAQCNGDSALCDKRYDEVVYVTTHNGFNYSPAFQAPNQSFPVSQQMVDGVRAFMLDVYDFLGTPTLYHGFIGLGSEPLEDVLIDIKQFLQANPTEILTLIFEANISASQMEAVFTSSGLDPYLHTQTLGQPWPTLQEMIDVDRRLVVLSDVDDAGTGQEWYHYMWDYCVETHYSNGSRADFSCEFNRGDSINSLFILNHFVTHPTLGTGELDSSVVANANPYFLNRANLCMVEKAHLPNFLTVDFYDVGDVFDTKDSLNANYVIETTDTTDTTVAVSLERIQRNLGKLTVFPNPSSGSIGIFIEADDLEGMYVEIRDLAGRALAAIPGNQLKSRFFEISSDEVGKGMFFVELRRGDELLSLQKIILH